MTLMTLTNISTVGTHATTRAVNDPVKCTATCTTTGSISTASRRRTRDQDGRRPARMAGGFACIGATFALLASASAFARAGEFRLEPATVDPTLLAGLEAASWTADATGDAADGPVNAQANDASGDQTATAAASSAPKPFGVADTWHFDLGGSYAIEIASEENPDGDSGDLGIANLGAHWFVADGLSFGAFAEAIYASQEPDDAFGGGAGLLARWYFLRDERFTLFFEGGCGFVVFDTDTPPGGTHFNLTPRLGGGATVRLSDTAQLVARVGWFHISNAQTGDENPGYDSIAIGGGIAFEF